MPTPSVPIVTTSPDQARAASTRTASSFGELEEQNKSLKSRQDAQREQALKNSPSQARRRVRSAAQVASTTQKNRNGNGSRKGVKNKEVKPLKLPKDYDWNLPPHQWSLPVKPKNVDEQLYIEPGKYGYFSPPGEVPEKYRRGRIWWYYNANNTYVTADGNKKTQGTGKDRRIGFQFMWNPDQFNTSVALNTEVTPHPADIFASVAGAFPSGETLSLQIRLDRTNDFACMKHLLQKTFDLQLDQRSGSAATFERMAQYYKTGFFAEADASKISEKILDLVNYGTVADLEYLYKAVNGPDWKSITGRSTGDIGYLAATLLRVDIGPLSYVGYINNLNVTHTAFSQDMTPIRTDVSIAMNLMASAGIASIDKAVAIAPEDK